MLPRIFLFACFTLSILGTYAQTGTLTGTVTDSNDGNNLPFANLFVPGTTYGTSTDIDGKFTLQLPAGKYNLVITILGYVSDTQKINIIANNTTTLNISLVSDAKLLGPVDVGANRITNTETAVILETRRSDAIVNAISATQISKTQDRNTTDVLKRVPGVTIVGSNFVMIRGLSERYNNVLLNGVLTPSAEVDKKAFSFDAIPSSALDRVLIHKTATADLPGEFAGGIIKVYTRNFADSNRIDVGAAISYRSGTTFNTYYHGGTNTGDVFGLGTGKRNLPSSFPASLSNINDAEYLSNLGKNFANNWAPNQTTAIPDLRFNFQLLRNFLIGKIRTSTITVLNYSNNFQSYRATNLSYNQFNEELQESDKIYEYIDDNYINTVRTSLMHNWAFQLKKGHKLEFRNFLNQLGTYQAVLRSGLNIEENSDVRDFSYQYYSRTIFNSQLAGTHDLANGTSKINWTGGFSKVIGKQPDFRRVRTRKTIGSADDTPYTVIISPVASTLDAGRFFSNLDETLGMMTADFEHEFNRKKKEKPLGVLKTGVYYEYKQRTFSARWMSYKKARSTTFNQDLLVLPLGEIFAAENINNTDGFALSEGTNPSDRYDATNQLIAGYVSFKFVASQKLTILPGLRVEYNVQELTSRTFADRPILVYNPIASLLPSLNMAYSISEKQQLRIAYYRTINRPEFRELAPFSFYDFQFNMNVYGNEDLKTPDIHNADLRWEYYPSNGEMISAAIFYKHFINPIEMFFVPGGGSGGTKDFTFGNAEYSRNLGVELEARKTISLGANSKSGDLTVVANAAYIYSNVSLGSQAVGQSQNRPMMGQSPFIINLGVFYELPKKQLQLNVMYNVIGKRIFAVGTAINPDIYEMPRNVLDLTVSKGFGRHWLIKAGVQDMLNSKMRLIQDSNNDAKITGIDEDIMSFREGVYITAGFNYKF